MGCGASKSNLPVATTDKNADKPQVLFVLGGPGSGKGTQCQKIVDHYGYKHISAGDCLREEQAKDDSTDRELIANYIANGQIVPVEITVRLLLNKMASLGYESPFLIDGFPRNIDNLDGWNTHAGDKVHVIGCLFIECTEDQMTERILKRAETSGRTDDNIEAAQKRFRVFETETLPIVQKFESEGRLYRVSGEGDIQETWEGVQGAITASKKSTLDSLKSAGENIKEAFVDLGKTATGAASQTKNAAKESFDASKESAEKKLHETKAAAEKKVEERKESAEKALHEKRDEAVKHVEERKEEAVKTVTERAEGAAKSVAEHTKNATEAANHAKDAAVDKLDSARDTAAQAVKERTAAAQEGVHKAAEGVVGTVEGAAGAVADKVSSVDHHVAEKVHEAESHVKHSEAKHAEEELTTVAAGEEEVEHKDAAEHEAIAA